MSTEAMSVEEHGGWHTHDLYTDADKDRPDVICDRNGQVVLSLCKRCGRGEAELETPCDKAKQEQRSVSEHMSTECVGDPVAWDGDCVLGYCGSPAGCEASMCCRADTTPYSKQQRIAERKPLTDEQMLKLLDHYAENPSDYRYNDPLICFARAIEAAHGINATLKGEA